MFKIFPGYQLVESYHEWKKAHRTEDKTISRLIRLGIAIVAALTIWCLPLETLGIAGLTVIQKRTMAIFLFATLMWLFEAVPAWTTSVMVVVLLLFTTSDSSLVFFRNGIDPEILGHTTSYKSLLHCFADPIIMLFIGGFVLAIAASKSGLDVFLARVMLKPFGKNPKFVLLGFILVTGVFSMFLSNTATAAMMLTFLGPVLKSLPADGKGKTALALAIPIAANVGGMGTPIGTPPNAIALKYLNDPAGLNMNIGFGEWMAFMLPFTIVLLLIAWVILLKLFPFKAKTIELNIEGEVKKDWRSIVVYVTFICTVLLWVLDKYTGVNSNVVAMLPVGVFAITGVLTKRDLEEISWSVLWMVAGGFALGVALQETGLASTLIAAIPFDAWPPVIMVVGSGLICYAMANFISHTATAALLVPILAVVGISVSENLAPLGGVSTLLIGVAIGSSLGMVLPISTPPNAIAHSTGMIQQKEMATTGIIMGVIGLVLGYSMLIFLGSHGLI
ncbi:MAG: SLC13 family permease [Candidatus Cryptobacteroides sp.]